MWRWHAVCVWAFCNNFEFDVFFFHLLFLLFLFRTLFFEWLRWSSSIVSRSWRRCIECLFLSSPNWSLPWCCTIGGTDRSTTRMKITNKKMRSSTQFNVLLLTSPLQHSISHLYCNEIVMKIEYAFVFRTIYCEMCHWFYYQSVSSNALERIFVFIRGTQLTLLACGGGNDLLNAIFLIFCLSLLCPLPDVLPTVGHAHFIERNERHSRYVCPSIN